MNEVLYLDCAELAGIIRRELKQVFPQVKFAVKSHRYAGGSSVDVRWTAGPLTAAVDAQLARYMTKGFDGMTDCPTNAGPVRLDDGRVVKIGSWIHCCRLTAAEAR